MSRPAPANRLRRSREDRDAEAPTFFLLSAPAAVGETVELSAEEARHALRALRLPPGVIVSATDGLGGRYRLRLVPADRRCLAEVLEKAVAPPPRPRLEVGVGAGRRERFLWCVEKLTELEVARVSPLLTATVQRRSALALEGGARYAARVRARAVSALKQSRGLHLPAVSDPEDVRAWARRPFEGRSLLLAFPAPGVRALAALVAERPDEAYRLAVGPEGGFLPDEEAALADAGFAPAHLGERRLRFETAAVVATCHVRAALAVAAGEAPCSS
jgi:16S rRNA (uracil1498-N3)-methyltransferase